MTRTRYIIAKCLASFGILPAEKYRTAAAFEAHLLRDSETVIGELAWIGLEDVENVSSEYWKIRKLSKVEDDLNLEIDKLTESLDAAQEARAVALEEVAEATKSDVTERDKAAENIDRLHQERDDIQRDGRSIKRAHSGLKTKLEVLLEEAGEEGNATVEATRKEIRLKREQFEEIKTRRDEIDQRINTLQKKLNELNAVIEKENKEIRERAEQQFGTIGRTNKELTSLRNKLGQIEVEKSELCTEVGKFIVQNSKDPIVRNAAQKHRGLLSLINQVRASSNRHRNLLGI